MSDDNRDLIRRLAVCLDACLPHLDRAAASERIHGEGRARRPVTNQRRVETARKALREAGALLGMEDLGA